MKIIKIINRMNNRITYRIDDVSEIDKLQRKLENAMEEAKAANIAKNVFLANMSHEMRTPLNAIIGLSELILSNEELNAELESKLEKIYVSGMTLLGIVNDTLDISKIESGDFKINPVKYNTPSLINDTMTLNITRIGEKPVTFNLFVDENLPERLYGDELRIKQIFNNLLSNAFKYTNSGAVEWRVSYKRDGRNRGNAWLVSSVQDDGIGIKSADISRLFSGNRQADAKAYRTIDGTGLGLLITKRLVEMMGGTITVESEYGRGSTFTVHIRQRCISNTPIGKEVVANLMSARYAASKRADNAKFARINLAFAHVLVVDDVEINLDVVKGILNPYGVNVDCASSGQQAIDKIRAENPHYSIVFMDHMMPGMDGIEATRIIHGEIGTDYARNIPIIALTANAVVGSKEMFLKSGFQAFISKPIDIVELDAVLRKWVKKRT